MHICSNLNWGSVSEMASSDADYGAENPMTDPVCGTQILSIYSLFIQGWGCSCILEDPRNRVGASESVAFLPNGDRFVMDDQMSSLSNVRVFRWLTVRPNICWFKISFRSVVKSRLQLQKQNNVYRGMRHAFVDIVRTEGFTALYRVCTVNRVVELEILIGWIPQFF